MNINFKNIFFSHLININNFPIENDHFFGQMPFLNIKNSENLIALFNHGKYKIKDLNNLKKNKKNVYLILNFNYSFYNNIKILKNIFKQDRKLRLLIKNENNQSKKQCLEFASLSLYKYSTFRNLCFYNFISNFFEKNNFKNVFLTFEGHSWERLVINAAKKNLINVIAYNQSGLFRMQHAAIRMLDEQFNPNEILTSGINSYEIFKDKNFQEIKINNIGSNRVINTNKFKKSKKFNFNILVLTEGIKNESLLLYSYINKLAQKNPNIKFYIRMHPEFNYQKLKKFISLKNKNNNIIFSNLEFEELLDTCFFVMHRGSTAVVQAVSNGLIPLYILRENEKIFSPISRILLKKNIIKHSDILNIVEKLNVFKNLSVTENQLNYTNSYYTKFNKHVFNKYL